MPENPKPVSLDVAQRIDIACDQFENDWKSGKNPKIEDFISSVEKTDVRELLRSLLYIECELLQKEGRKFSADSFNSRFAKYADVVSEVLESIRRSKESAADLKEGQQQTLSLRDVSVDTSQMNQTARPKQSASVPQIMGRFEIVEVLGEGAFGTVYRARDPQLDREVALKVPRAGVLETQEDVERFLREARAAATLRHANICPIYDFGKIEGDDFIVMAYIEGQSLSTVLSNNKQIPSRKIAVSIRKIALALGEAHKHGVVHRDLKPSNIMIDKRGEPVVMDFGLARRVSDDDSKLTHSGAIVGTPAYMPPEQARGMSKEVGPRSDVYSLGVILYELLCGNRPFSGSLAKVMADILHKEPQPPSVVREDVDPQLEAICLKAMAKQSEDRYESMTAFADALADYLRSVREEKGDTPSDAQEVGALKSLAESRPLPVPPLPDRKQHNKGGFDPYHKWLGIPPDEQPPHHYRLLGVNVFENDADVIDSAAERQMSYLHQINGGPHLAESQRLLNELAAARICLLNPQKKKAYDVQLRQATQIPHERVQDTADDTAKEALPDLPPRLPRTQRNSNWWKRIDKRLAIGGASLLSVLLGIVIIIRSSEGTTKIEIEQNSPNRELGSNGDSKKETNQKLSQEATDVGENSSELGELHRPKRDNPITAVSNSRETIRESEKLRPSGNQQSSATTGEWTTLFNGRNFNGWTGDLNGYKIEHTHLISRSGIHGNLYSEREYGDFALRFDFKLLSGSNSGIGLRAPLYGNVKYHGIEIQIYDDTKQREKPLLPYQRHGSIYGVVPAQPGHLKPLGEWNSQEMICRGSHIQIILNGTTILDSDLSQFNTEKAPDGKAHPGLKRIRGHIVIQSQGIRTEFRHIQIREYNEGKPSASLEKTTVEKQKTPDQWTALFNAEDLSGWTASDPLNWNVADGVLSGQQSKTAKKPTRLKTVQEFGDYQLEFEYRLVHGSRGAVYLHSEPNRQANKRYLRVGLVDNNATFPARRNRMIKPGGNARHGGLPSFASPRGDSGHLIDEENGRPSGKWNSMSIRTEGMHVTVTVNGKQLVDSQVDKTERFRILFNRRRTVKFENLKRRRGAVEFTVTNKVIEFRNVRIGELNPVTVNKTKSPETSNNPES